MTITEEIFKLFKKNFPDIIRSEETVKEVLEDENNHIIKFTEDDKLIGVSVINENVIYLLCVDRPYERRGIGTQLLKKSEEYIMSNGFNKISIGAGKEYIMPGVPMNNNAHEFFKKFGYYHSWGDCGCYDMSQSLEAFQGNEACIGDTIDKITYRWATIDDLGSIIACVSDAAEEFVQYYRDESLYLNNTHTPVLIAKTNNEVVGALIVSVEAEGKGIGSVGCTATMSKYRNRGIATNMVKLGTKYLKDIGLERAVLGYTYTQLLSLYASAGYKVSMEYFMGEKLFDVDTEKFPN